MKCILILAAIVGISCLVEAFPQGAGIQKLPNYYRTPSSAPQRKHLRFRRSNPVVIKDSIATNSLGGQDVSLSATKVIGNEQANAFGTVFAQGNTKTGGAVTGATVGVNGPGVGASITKASSDIGESFIKTAQANLYRSDLNSVDAKFSQTDNKLKGFDIKSQEKSGSLSWTNAHGVGASISRDINTGVSDTLTKSLSANIFNSPKHNLDATVFNSHVKQNNGFNFQKTGGMLDYAHAGGHGLNAGLTRFSGVGDRANVGGYSNLFTSNDGHTKLNANAGASQWLNGPFSGQRDYGFGLGLSHNGWRG